MRPKLGVSLWLTPETTTLCDNLLVCDGPMCQPMWPAADRRAPGLTAQRTTVAFGLAGNSAGGSGGWLATATTNMAHARPVPWMMLMTALLLTCCGVAAASDGAFPLSVL